MNAYRILFVIALLSASLIAYQVNLVMIFSLVQWYHFAYMAISIALLGYGMAGSLLAVFKTPLLGSFDIWVPRLCCLTTISMAALMWLEGSPLLHFETLHFQLSAGYITRLIASYVVLIVPFFFGALCIGLAFTKFAGQISKLYASDLIGAAVGAIISIVLSFEFFPHHSGLILSLFPLIAAFISMDRQVSRAWIMPGITVIGLAFFWSMTDAPRPSQYKPLSKTLLLPDAQTEFRQPHPAGVLHVVSSSALRSAPDLSLSYGGNVPVVKGVFRNGEWIGALGEQLVNDTTHLYRYTGYALPFFVESPGAVLVMGDETGTIAQFAARQTPDSVVVLLENGDLKDLLKRFVSDTDSIIYRSNTFFHIDHSRSFFIRNQSNFDLVILPAAGEPQGSGLAAIGEDYIMTKENLELIWHRLSPTGMIVISCRFDVPSRAPLRAFHLMVNLLRSYKIDNPLQNIIAIKNWGTTTFLMRRTAWNEIHHTLADSFCISLQFDPLVNHNRIMHDSAMIHTSGDSAFMPMVRYIAQGDEEELESYDLDVSIPTDNRPFFNQFVKIPRIKKLVDSYGPQSLHVEMGYFFVWLTFSFLLIFAFLFIVLPLFRIGFAGPLKGFTLLYFAMIGIGFMGVEMTFIHRSIPYLGTPASAVSTILAALLVSSGAGSWYSRKFRDRIGILQYYGAVLLVFLLAAQFWWDDIWSIIGQLRSLRLVLAFVMISIPGFFMGMFFPLGIHFLDNVKDSSSLIPWAWGINGFFSVVSATGALILAIESGYGTVIYLSVIMYGLAIVVSRIFSR